VGSGFFVKNGKYFKFNGRELVPSSELEYSNAMKSAGKLKPKGGDLEVKTSEKTEVTENIPEEEKIGDIISDDDPLIPGTTEHKAQRWKDYKERGGEWTYERWSSQYEVSMANYKVGLAREEAYRKAMGGVNKMKETPLGYRQIDIYKESELYMGQLKTGKVYLTEQAKIDIKKDAWFVKRGYTVEHILEQGASEPYLEALKSAGIAKYIGSKIP
jgi:hypothetical protein